jgi:hypothetical protein
MERDATTSQLSSDFPSSSGYSGNPYSQSLRESQQPAESAFFASIKQHRGEEVSVSVSDPVVKQELLTTYVLYTIKVAAT